VFEDARGAGRMLRNFVAQWEYVQLVARVAFPGWRLLRGNDSTLEKDARIKSAQGESRVGA
jgi:hypothetical protein